VRREGAGEDGAGLILFAAVDRVEHGGFEIAGEARGEIIRGWQLMEIAPGRP
jgi:hypothetical protein